MNLTNEEADDMEFRLWRWAKYRPEENMAALKAIVRAEVVNLRALEREVIYSHFWEDLTISEIALCMGLSEKSVGKLLEMALSTLKRRLVTANFGKDSITV